MAVTASRVQDLWRVAKRQGVQLKKEMVILPSNRRPRRAALLAASQKAEKCRQSFEVLMKLITAQGEGMVQETLAAMRALILTEDNLEAVVIELSNRFPVPTGDEFPEGAGQAANSMGPLYATQSPSRGGFSPATGGASPFVPGDYDGNESCSTDSDEDVKADMRLLGYRVK